MKIQLMNKPTRLRMILARYTDNLLEDYEQDKNLHRYKYIDELEHAIQTHVKGLIHNAKELGLSIDSDNFIGDLD